jgi:3-hydroxyisobutyrate dehydrogenase-like beta-hydroxyacid dehydrogenase
MSKIAFLGLGMMGAPMATRLLEAGNEVTVWNRSPERTEPLAHQGAEVSGSAAQAVVGAEFIITMLATPQALDEVLFGEKGMANSLVPGQIWVDMSTVGPAEFRSAAERLPDGVHAVDAPVRGSVPEATDGRLHIFVGAGSDEIDGVRLLLAPLGDVRHVGGPGAGASMKLVVNSALVGAMVAAGEALALGRSLGLETGTLLDVLAESPVGPVVRAKRVNIETSHYPPSFKLELAAKDMGLVSEAGDAAGLELRAAKGAVSWLEKSMSEGAGDLDFSAVVATILGEPPRA